MKKTLSSVLLVMLLLSIVGCSKNGDDAVLPPSRIGTEGSISSSLEQHYTFETAYSASDLVAHIKVGNWLGEDDEICITYYEATVIDNYTDGKSEKIILLQDGTSKRTLKAYPLFTSGNELLVFLKCAEGTEYENAYWIIGSFTTILDVVSSDSGEMYYVDRYGMLGETMSLPNYASQSSLSSELYANAVKLDSIIADMQYSFPYIFSKSDVELLINNQ